MNIGIDLGGTNIAGGLVKDGTVIKRLSVATPKTNDPNDIVSTIANLAHQLAERSVHSVGIGVPGIVEGDFIHSCANLGWTNVPFRRLWNENSQLPFVLGNDATLAGLAEFERRGAKNAVLLTLGTGLGSSIIVSDVVIEGIGAEIGHTIIVKGGRPCGCGRNGCLEQYASSTALIRTAKECMMKNSNTKLSEVTPEEIDGKLIFELAKDGDVACIEAIDSVAEHLAIGIVNLVATLGVDLVLLGGGIAEAGDALIEPTKAHVERLKYFPQMKLPKIEQAILKNDAGIIGAAELARRSMR